MKIRNLSVLSYATGFTLWLYRCEDFTQSLEQGYFLPVADMFKQGDMIIIVAPNGVAQRYIKSCDHNSVLLGVLA